jgi:glyoxylase-like metal-dependent hydrolase (beta-lactamase superfamily II)
MHVQHFYDPTTFTLSYVVWDEATRDAVVIDPVLDYDPLASKTSTTSVAEIAAFVEKHSLRLHAAIETHAHADHLSGGQFLKEKFGAKVAIGYGISKVQSVFKRVFDLPEAFPEDGSQFDLQLKSGETFRAGSLEIRPLATPGHTPACTSYLIGDAVFTGDTLFIEDYGTGRCDFPAGSAADLYQSIHGVLYALPDSTRVFVGHDYQPEGRPLRWETTIGRSKEANIHVRTSTTEVEFTAFRTARDKTLQAPRLLYPSVQVNIDAGRLPEPRANGMRYLAIPLKIG